MWQNKFKVVVKQRKKEVEGLIPRDSKENNNIFKSTSETGSQLWKLLGCQIIVKGLLKEDGKFQRS